MLYGLFRIEGEQSNLNTYIVKQITHKKTRNEEKYTVKFANTKRLKTGSVITTQNYLNEDERQNRKRNCC